MKEVRLLTINMSAKGEKEKNAENTLQLEISEQPEENNNEVEISNDDERCVSTINKPLHSYIIYIIYFAFSCTMAIILLIDHNL